MVMKIKKLKEPIELKLEQYECELCHKKCYINTEDKKGRLKCPFCNEDTKNIRIFEINIKGIGEYEK